MKLGKGMKGKFQEFLKVARLEINDNNNNIY